MGKHLAGVLYIPLKQDIRETHPDTGALCAGTEMNQLVFLSEFCEQFYKNTSR